MIRALRQKASGEGALGKAVLAAILIHSAGIFFYSTIWRTATDPAFDVNDFKAYYAGALALSEGRRDLLYPDPATLNLGVLPDQPWVRFSVERGVPTPSGYIYPPFLAVVLRPLTSLPYHRANQAWFLLNVILFTASAAMLVTLRPGRVDSLAAGMILFACLNFYPTYRAFQCGQAGLLILFLLCGSIWALSRGRHVAAGSLVAAAAMVKLTPALLIVWFGVTRKWRAFAGSIASGAVLLAISIAGAGWEAHETFLREMLPALSRGAATFANQSFAGFLDRIALDVTMNAFEFVDEPSWLRALSRSTGAAIVFASLWLAARLARRGAPDHEGFSLLVMASLLASPISWEHHYVAALLAIASLVLIAAREPAASARFHILFAAGYVLLASNAYDLIRRHFPYAAGRVAISYAFYGGVLLWLLLSRHAFRREIGVAAGPPGVATPHESGASRGGGLA